MPPASCVRGRLLLERLVRHRPLLRRLVLLSKCGAPWLRWLRSKALEIRAEVGRRVVLKYLPKFEYLLDHSAARSAQILHVLDEIEHPKPKDE